ncbi:GGDEF domain-containing protein [Wukongibacter baidiensis]|uniref:GGDEF domain-containing protein n=1 Tax=Wukongibacter baidiensis TaxID=1723361 RepID=UPI003D7F711E
MKHSINKKVIGLTSIPIGLTIATYILIFNVSKLPKSWTMILQYISYFFFFVGMLLGSRFNKSKVFFLSLILVLSQLILSYGIIPTYSVSLETIGIFDILSFVIPINIFLFPILKERGILTSWGKIRLGFIIFQIMMIWWVIQPEQSQVHELIYHRVVTWKFVDMIPMPQVSMIAFLCTFIFINIRMLLKPNLMNSSLIGVILMVFTGFILKEQFLALQISFAMSGLILIIGVVEASYFMAYSDELTGIPARRALNESMMKLGGKYVIAMTDIDFFKKFNDTYGHDTGDEVLKMVASGLQKVKSGGKAFRYGGEEFTIVFPGKTQKDVIPHLEELRENISKQKYSYKKKRKVNGKEKIVSKDLSVTISIGVAEKSDKYKSPEEVLKAADKALYRAKKKGRNCVSK